MWSKQHLVIWFVVISLNSSNTWLFALGQHSSMVQRVTWSFGLSYWLSYPFKSGPLMPYHEQRPFWVVPAWTDASTEDVRNQIFHGPLIVHFHAYHSSRWRHTTTSFSIVHKLVFRFASASRIFFHRTGSGPCTLTSVCLWSHLIIMIVLGDGRMAPGFRWCYLRYSYGRFKFWKEAWNPWRQSRASGCPVADSHIPTGGGTGYAWPHARFKVACLILSRAGWMMILYSGRSDPTLL